MTVLDRLMVGWNAFRNKEEVRPARVYNGYGPSSSEKPDRTRLRYYNERSIVSAIYTRIAIDVASVDIRHVKLDDKGRYAEDADSFLNAALNFEPNLDQGPRAFKQEAALNLCDKGCIAIVPVDTVANPELSDSFDVFSLRVGHIVDWYPDHVKMLLYNEKKGEREEITLRKTAVAIIENPLYSVMNEPNSTLQRLIHKLGLLDAVDEQSGSGKLDLIIQLPYVVKSEARKNQAETRRKDIEVQLKSSKYGIAYTDGAEKITQLNRPAENNLLEQVQYLTEMLYDQLGITKDVMSGTADEATMINYHHRTIEPIVKSITEAMARSFLGVKGRNKKEAIHYFKDPFRLMPLSDLADIVDKLTRNEIVTSNEVRGFLGLPPSKEPRADSLANPNMPDKETKDEAPKTADTPQPELQVV